MSRTLGDLFEAGRKETSQLIRAEAEETRDSLPGGLLWRMLRRRVDSQVDKVLETPIEEILGRGWRALKQLQEYKELPAWQEFGFKVGEHTITSLQEPTLEIDVDGHHIGKLEFSLAVTLELDGTTLRGKDGHIERAEPGKCTAAGDFSCKVTIYDISKTVPDPGPLTSAIDVPFPKKSLTFAHPIAIP